MAEQSDIAYSVNIGHIGCMSSVAPYPVKKLVNFTDEQAAQIADYRFKHRLKSENEAIRALIQRGLGSETAKSSAAEQKA